MLSKIKNNAINFIITLLLIPFELILTIFAFPFRSEKNLKIIQKEGIVFFIFFSMIVDSCVYLVFGINVLIVYAFFSQIIPLVYEIIQNKKISFDFFDKLLSGTLFITGLLFIIYDYFWDKLIPNNKFLYNGMNQAISAMLTGGNNVINLINKSELARKIETFNFFEKIKAVYEITIVSMGNTPVGYLSIFSLSFLLIVFLALRDNRTNCYSWKLSYYYLIPYIIIMFITFTYSKNLIKYDLEEKTQIFLVNIREAIVFAVSIYGVKEVNYLLKSKKRYKELRYLLSAVLFIIFSDIFFVYGAFMTFFKNKKRNITVKEE